MTNSNTGGDPFSLIPETVLYADISDGAYRVYGLLARIVDTKSWEGYALVKTLADRLGKSESYIKRHMKELVAANLIDSVPQWTDGDGDYSTTQHSGWRQTANIYRLPLNRSMGFKSAPPVKSDTHPSIKTERGVGFKSDLQNHSPHNPKPNTLDAPPPFIKNGELSNASENLDHVQDVTLLNARTDIFHYDGSGPPPF